MAEVNGQHCLTVMVLSVQARKGALVSVTMKPTLARNCAQVLSMLLILFALLSLA